MGRLLREATMTNKPGTKQTDAAETDRSEAEMLEDELLAVMQRLSSSNLMLKRAIRNRADISARSVAAGTNRQFQA